MKKMGENKEKLGKNGLNCGKTWDTKEKHE